MSRFPSKIIPVLFSTLLSILLLGSSQASQRSTAHNNKQKQSPAPQPVVPEGPLPQPTLDQMPAIPPQVTYQGGQLTIQAQNSTLGDILRAVHAKTGASVDIPSNATERVVGRLGPGPAREVLASLLNGSHFNYVMVGSATDPGGVQQVILTSKSGGTTAAAGESATQAAIPSRSQSRPAPKCRARPKVRSSPMHPKTCKAITELKLPAMRMQTKANSNRIRRARLKDCSKTRSSRMDSPLSKLPSSFFWNYSSNNKSSNSNNNSSKGSSHSSNRRNGNLWFFHRTKRPISRRSNNSLKNNNWGRHGFCNCLE